jgi:polysaccharide pyruvyl transferase WcaK-like protein
VEFGIDKGKDMNSIGIHDPAIGTGNIGDYIISDSVERELNEVFKYNFKISFPSQEKISLISYRKINKMKYTFVGGSNLLSSNMNKRNQWKINMIDAIFINKAILIGVGWWQYQQKPNLYTRLLLKRVLNNNYIHSVRDSFTENQLKSIGITNILNTACPTTWMLTDKHCQDIPRKKAENVVTTITDYMKDFKLDKILIEILQKNYKKVFLWIQGSNDFEYFQSLKIESKVIEIIPPSLKEYDYVLENNESLDFVGTRLHAGIRALQKKKRTIVVAIDNRAIEKSKDINLKIINRNNLEYELENLINIEFTTKINLPLENIERWKKQFKKDIE